ncbi:MAG TPA: hypothetical protein VFC18_17545 [Burkholderiales bacterium]|nr:hypothetical protein [Burkholderiales bacterium]
MRLLRRTADRWGAAMAGGLLFALPVADGFYRGVFDRVNLVVALMGVGGIRFAVIGFARRRLPAAAAGLSKEI